MLKPKLQSHTHEANSHPKPETNLNGPKAVDPLAELDTSCGKVKSLLDGISHSPRESTSHAKATIVQDFHGNLQDKIAVRYHKTYNVQMILIKLHVAVSKSKPELPHLKSIANTPKHILCRDLGVLKVDLSGV